MNPDDICEVVITGPTIEWLTTFSRELVSDRLAACAQHFESIRSIYRWDNGIQDDREARVALHTRLSLVPTIVERANRDHPYDVPCVLAIPISGGNPEYAEWVIAETRIDDGMHRL